MVDQAEILKKFYAGKQGAHEMDESIKKAKFLLKTHPGNQISASDLFHEAYGKIAKWPNKGGRHIPTGLGIQQSMYYAMRDVLRKLRPLLRRKQSDGTIYYVSRTKSLGSELDDATANDVLKEYVDERTGLTCEELFSTMEDEKALKLLRAALAADIDFTDTQVLSEQLKIPLPEVRNTKKRISRWADDIRTNPDSEAAKRARALYEALEPNTANAPFRPPSPPTHGISEKEHQKNLTKLIGEESGDSGAHARGQLDALSTSDLELIIILLRANAAS